MDHERVLDIIGEALDDPNQRVRITALTALAALDSDAARRRLAERLLFEPVPEVRGEIRRHIRDSALTFDDIVLEDGRGRSLHGSRLLGHATEEDVAWRTDAIRILAGLRAETLERLLSADDLSVRVARVVCDAARGERGEVRVLALRVLVALPLELIQGAVGPKQGLSGLAEHLLDLMVADPESPDAAPARAALLRVLPGLSATRLRHRLWSMLLATGDPGLRGFAHDYDRIHGLSSPWGIVSTWWSPLRPPLRTRAAGTGLGCVTPLLTLPAFVVLAFLLSRELSFALAGAMSMTLTAVVFGGLIVVVAPWLVQPVGRRLRPLRSLLVEQAAATPFIILSGILVLASNLLSAAAAPDRFLWCVVTLVLAVAAARAGAALSASVLAPTRPVAGLTRVALFAGSLVGGVVLCCSVLVLLALVRPTSSDFESDGVWAIMLVLAPSLSAGFAWIESSGPWPLQRAYRWGAALLLLLALFLSGWALTTLAFKGSKSLREAEVDGSQGPVEELDLQSLLEGAPLVDTFDQAGAKTWIAPDVPYALCVRVKTTDKSVTRKPSDPDLEVEVRDGSLGLLPESGEGREHLPAVWKGDDPPEVVGLVRSGRTMEVRAGKFPLQDPLFASSTLVSLPPIIQRFVFDVADPQGAPDSSATAATQRILIEAFRAPPGAGTRPGKHSRSHEGCEQEAKRRSPQPQP